MGTLTAVLAVTVERRGCTWGRGGATARSAQPGQALRSGAGPGRSQLHRVPRRGRRADRGQRRGQEHSGQGALRARSGPTAGDILVEGNVVHLSSPLDARRYGIETVYQDLALAPDLDAAANLHLGREIYRLRALVVLNKPEMRDQRGAGHQHDRRAAPGL